MAPRDAVEMARSRGLDLVEVAPNAQPPVCRIVDYGKYKYEQGKKDREAAKKQRQAAEIKGMTLRPGTDDHDLDFKIKNIVKFLGDGEKVKVTVRFRSREMSHPEFAQASLNKIVAAAVDAGVGAVERPATMEGKQMILVLSPTREATKKAAAANAPVKKPSIRTESAPKPGIAAPEEVAPPLSAEDAAVADAIADAKAAADEAAALARGETLPEDTEGDDEAEDAEESEE